MAKRVLLIITVSVFSAFLGYGAGLMVTKDRNYCDPKDTFKAGMEAARLRLQETGIYFQINNGEPIYQLTGNVEKIGTNEILLRIVPLSPLDDADLDLRTIDIKGAQIIKRVRKNDEEFKKEMDDFFKVHPEVQNSAGSDLQLPYSYREESGVLGDISIGAELYVYSDNDVRTEKNILADKIIIIN